MAITHRTLQLIRQLANDVTKITDAQTRALVTAWADAWDEVAPDLEATLFQLLAEPKDDKVTTTLLYRSKRIQLVLNQIADRLTALTETATSTVVSDLQPIVTATAAAQAPITDSQLPPGSGLIDPAVWARSADRALDAIVARSTQQITSRMKPIAKDTERLIRRELVRGVAAGAGPRETAARMVQRAEKRYNFGLTRALVIARTETLDAHRAAAKAAQDPHTEVLAGWIWLAKLDTHTCPSCWAQHGHLHPIEEPGPYDHQQGRCTRMPKTKTWAELGFTGLAEPADALPDANGMFADLPTAEQIEILGPSRHAAWVAGDFPINDWSTKRTTKGWRDSYGVAPVPDGYDRRNSGGKSSTLKSNPGRRSPKAA